MTENVLIASEAEFYINNINIGTIEDIGTKKWIDWHQRLQKLNQQAVLEASELREESIKEFLVSYNKLSILVHEAILMSVWRTKILPRLLKLQPEPENTFFLYSALYHEATTVTLLEIVLYHAESCEVLNDVVLDLIDYAYDAITNLIALKYKIKTSVIAGENFSDLEQIFREEFPRQKDNLLYDIGMRCISIIFHIIVNIKRFPLCATNRMLTTLDVPLLLVQLMEDKPWVKKTSKNETLHYIDGKWTPVTGEAEMKLTGHEAHVWLCLRQILMDSNTPNIYEYNEYRKSQLISLQKYLTEIVLDQIPPLIDFKHWLCQLSISDPPSQRKPIIIELVPEIKQRILSPIAKKLKSITIIQAKRFFTTDKEELLQVANSLNEAYNTDFLEKMVEKSEDNQNSIICAGCGRKGLKKCSKCKAEWYCGRECQVNHWPQHKEKCLEN